MKANLDIEIRIDLNTKRVLTCGTSEPARSPVLVTVNENSSTSVEVKVLAVLLSFPYVKFV